MPTLLIALAAGLGFIVAYHTYGRWLARRVFGIDVSRVTPAHTHADGSDYVPTKRAVVFGHHFTSIAGTGPIVGPAIAVMWGWLPALLWVVFGSIFIGAVHDFGALVVSLRNDGKTVGEIAGRVINRRVRLLFLLVLLMALTIVLAIFGLVIAAVFKQYPAAITPCLIQIPIALSIGVWLHRRGRGLFVPSLLALGVMYASVVWGDTGWLHTINGQLAAMPVIAWVGVLLFYSYVASVLPVWSLLQPRDYINSLQLLTALGLIVAGLVVAALWGGAAPVAGAARPALEVAAPMLDLHPPGAPPAYPFLFITIACGAISGFHCLVSSGTSSKQLESERDAQFVGYGSMLTEGFLATLVIIACVAGLGLGVAGAGGEWLTGREAYASRYADWGAASGLGAKVAAFVDGAANLLRALGLSAGIATALMAVLVASFAGTTLDTACRLQRYVVQELAGIFVSPAAGVGCGCAGCGYDLRGNVSGGCPECGALVGAGGGVRVASGRWTLNPLRWLMNKHGATIFAVVAAFWMAAMPVPGGPTVFPSSIDLAGAASLWEHLRPGGSVTTLGEGGVPTHSGSYLMDSGPYAGYLWMKHYSGKGGLILWPMFGATNQLLGGLAFLVILFWLKRRGAPTWFLVPPLLFMLAMPAWAMMHQLPGWWAADTKNWMLIVIAAATLVLEGWMVGEAVVELRSVKRES